MARPIKFSSVGIELTDEINAGHTYKTNKRIIKTIAVHCSFSPQYRGDTIHTIDEWHQANEGWGGVGYHYMVDEFGKIWKGRWVDNRGIHIRGFNKNSIGVLRLGGMGKNGKAVYDENELQIKGLQKLIGLLISEKMYNLSPEAVLGHNEYPRVTKSCPLIKSMDDFRDGLLNP